MYIMLHNCVYLEISFNIVLTDKVLNIMKYNIYYNKDRRVRLMLYFMDNIGLIINHRTK